MIIGTIIYSVYCMPFMGNILLAKRYLNVYITSRLPVLSSECHYINLLYKETV
jgi:hypothetical protein